MELQKGYYAESFAQNVLSWLLSFFDFARLEQTARGVLSDSGTEQEECCIFNVPNVTLCGMARTVGMIVLGYKHGLELM